MAYKKPRLVGSLNIDFEKFDDRDAEGKYLFSPENGVVTTRRKSMYLPNETGWDGPAITAVEEQLDIYTKVPITCRGNDCIFSADCSLCKLGIVERWVSSNCPLEVIANFRRFAGYINDLEVSPENYTDLQMINDIVRMQCIMARCDALAGKEDPVETLLVGTDVKSTLEHLGRQPSSYYALQEKLRKDINATYKMLLASRQSKIEADAKKKIKEDISTTYSDLMEAAREMREAEIKSQRDK